MDEFINTTNRRVRIVQFPEERITVAWQPSLLCADRVWVALAVAHPKDTWTRKRGRQIAEGRLRTPKNWVTSMLLHDLFATLDYARGTFGPSARDALIALIPPHMRSLRLDGERSCQ